MPITVLSADVAAQIAAGEVIERPASAVKELVENALDAGARVVAVEIERGGIDLIRVVDDGCGIAPEELALAVRRHATSKLRAVDDLASLHTFGFRGEALPSMAAAARFVIRSRVAGDEVGASLEVRDGVPGVVKPAAAPPGTSVTLRDLFGRQPARRAFLRTPTGEAAAVAQALSQAALIHPDVRFTLTVDGRTTLQTSGSGDPCDAAARVLGVNVAARLLPLDGHDGDPAITLAGFASPPELARKTRAAIHLFVNARPIQNRRLLYAVESAYDTLLVSGMHPQAVIDLRLPPDWVDVNVHPAKAEVRFRDERAVFSAVQSGVRRAVTAVHLVPSIAMTDDADPEDEVAQPTSAEVLSAPALWQPSLMAGPSAAQPVAPPRPTMPILRVIGQMGTTYIIAEGPHGMYLVDQHAAHERVLYERILARRRDTPPEMQALLNPHTVELSPAQAAVFGGAAEELGALGFEVEPFGERSLLLRAVPSLLAKRDPARAVTEFLDALADPSLASHGPERAPMTLACHAAVRAGMTLSLDEMRETVRLLETCDSPRTCPHGRPTMMHLSATTLEREFRRR